MRRRLVSIGIVFGVALALLPAMASAASAQAVPSPSAQSQSTGVGTITWGDCTDPTLVGFGAQCGMLSVPLDYARSSGPKIQIAVSRVLHTSSEKDYQGIMLVNPGGPGGSGLIYSVLGAFVPGDAGSTYDWIGFDPRGVGASVPALSCDPNYTAGPRPRYDPATFRIEGAWLVKAATYAFDCARSGLFFLGHLKTTDTVADMDAIRQSLGATQLSFYGFSYGTYLGQVYATLHPDLVKRMVLDSNVDPRTVWYQANLDQDPAFEITIQKFFDWVAGHNDVYNLGASGADVKAKYYDALASLAASPQGQLGASEWADAFLGAGYVQFLWPDTADAFAAFVNGHDPGPATALYLNQDTPGDDNGYAMYLATECTDARWPRSWLTWHVDNARVAVGAPFLTWGNAWFNAPCAFWLAPSGQPVNVDGSTAPPILLLDETLDAATPFTGSLEVRERFPKASLVATVGGVNHANSLFGGVSCVDDAVAAYLTDGTLPARLPGNSFDFPCPAAGDPMPNAAVVSPQANAQAPAQVGTATVTADQLRQLHPMPR